MKPSRPGWYWYKDTPTAEPAIVLISNGIVYSFSEIYGTRREHKLKDFPDGWWQRVRPMDDNQAKNAECMEKIADIVDEWRGQ